MKYSVKPKLRPDERDRLAGVSDILAHLLFHRGIKDIDAANRYISPDYDLHTFDPFLLKDAEKSADRIIYAIEHDEKIAIYADYDADGIPGAAIFHDLFHKIGFKNFVIYIPHRHNEGFGLNMDAIKHLIEDEKVKLIITVDCGITDVEPINLAKKSGVDLIVTDHHEPPDALPDAFAIIDHKQANCRYPDKNLCGSAVAYKLIQAILKKKRFGLKEGREKWLLDLVGIATLSDMVPLVGENRVFAYYGLAVLRKSPRKGLIQLLRHLKIDQRTLSEDDIAFMITPRINAASRMGAPIEAFNLLVAEDDDRAYLATKHLDAINTERKGIVASIVREMKRSVKERFGDSIPPVIVLGNPEWKPALLGLVANSCAEEFKRPVFLWGRNGDNSIKGSCRSDGSVHIVDLMKAAEAGAFSQFGGHHYSGGFAVGSDQVHFLEQRLNDAAKKMNLNAGSARGISAEIDAEIMLDDINASFCEDVCQLAPFGIKNPKPLFLFKGISAEGVRVFGKKNDHVEISFRKSGGEKIAAISFFGANSDWAKRLKIGNSMDLVASVEKSYFRGTPEVRLRVADVITL